MSAALAPSPAAPALLPAAPFRVPRLPSRLPQEGWRLAVAVAVALHLVLLGLGYLNRHDTLLDLIAKGEVQAIAPVQEKPLEQEVLLDDTPPPPPEPNPDFVKPEEVRPKLVEAPKPKPKPEAPPQPQAQPQISFAASGVVVGDKNFPKPPYPYDAKVRRFEGTVIVALNVVAGNIVSAEVAGSSGYGILDTAAVQWIRQKWHFPPDVTRTLAQPVKFQLSAS